MSAPYLVETVGKSRLPITSWCCTCDKELTMDDGIGPWNHLAGEGDGGPDHYVIQVEGRLSVYRPSDGNIGRPEVRSGG